jgi:putative ABC transport system permease protein
MWMAVFERTRETGIVTAMGLKRREIVGLFLLEGGLIGLLGALLGGALGGLVNAYDGRVGMEWAQVPSEYSELAALVGGRIYFQVGADGLQGRGVDTASQADTIGDDVV